MAAAAREVLTGIKSIMRAPQAGLFIVALGGCATIRWCSLLRRRKNGTSERLLMRIALLLAGLLLMYSGSSFAGPRLWSGKQLLPYYQAYESATAKQGRSTDIAGFAHYLGYIRGAYEVLEALPETDMCIDNSVTLDQIARVVGRYMIENPQELNLPAFYLVSESLKDAFPCK
ncbi:MAG TPA: Rap1a/Tai family immunity protein [Burkholderiales bacterium]|nr:Rap1a/Tai family immunity protein [Burkholderiales bacterium]